MILEAVFGFLFAILNGFVDLFPAIEFSVPASVLDTVDMIVSTCCYFLPMGTVVSILSIVVMFNVFKICISFVRTVWELIPFL